MLELLVLSHLREFTLIKETRTTIRPNSKSKLKLDSKKVELEVQKNFRLQLYFSFFALQVFKFEFRYLRLA